MSTVTARCWNTGMDNTTVWSNKLQYKSSKVKFHQVLFQQRKLMLPVKIVKCYIVNVKTA